MTARFIGLITVALADNEGLHHLNEAAAISLLQTSSSMKITQDPATFGAKGGGGAKGFGAKGVPKVPSPGPPSGGGGGGGGSCKAAKDALKTARQAAGTACEGEPTDYVAPPEGMTAVDQYKIFPPPEEDDLSSMKSCKEGWMAHTTMEYIYGPQCWGGAAQTDYDVKGPLGSYRVSRSESNHLTPSACLELVWKISRQTGVCNPNVTNRKHNLPANYRFTGCAAEFWDQTSPDVLTVPAHIQEETQFNNYRTQSKFGSCRLCGTGAWLGDGQRTYGTGNGKKDDVIGMGKAGILRRDSHDPIVRMTCILNPGEKDGFELLHKKDY